MRAKVKSKKNKPALRLAARIKDYEATISKMGPQGFTNIYYNEKINNMLHPEILTHPNIPLPLHGIAPRILMGQTQWNIERKKCYAKAEQKCEACGTAREDAWPNRWLEAHEEYTYFPNGHIVFKRLVCLCPACHKFIHSGMREIMVSQGYMTKELNAKIQDHGIRILKKHGLMGKYMSRHDWAFEEPLWKNFRMIFEGKEYGPSSPSYKDWARGVWRNWKP